MKRPLLALLGVLGVAAGWRRRGHARSLAVRRLAAALPNPAKRRGLDMRIPVDRGPWIRLTLRADLSHSLSEVVGHPVEAAAHSRFAGFHLSGVYSDFLNPNSGHYQAWVGAYVVFDGDGRRRFGFDDEGKPVQQDTLDVLEADQRLVLGGAGCPHAFPDGRLVRLTGDMEVTELDEGAEHWWRMDGSAETWSAYHRGDSPGSHWRSAAGYGRVPDDTPHPVDDFHPLVYNGSFWLRYSPEWKATCAKFFIYPEYIDRNGRLVTNAPQLQEECRAIVERISFDKT